MDLIVWVNIQQYFAYSLAQMVPSLPLGAIPVGSCASLTPCVVCVRVSSTSVLSGAIVKSLSRVRLFATPQTVVCPGSYIHGIFQARILEWVAISFSRRSSESINTTGSSCLFPAPVLQSVISFRSPASFYRRTVLRIRLGY